MEYITASFRHAGVILNESEFIDEFSEILEVLNDISDEDIINKHCSFGKDDKSKIPKSLSPALNELIKERLKEKSWKDESGIFQDTEYQGDTWRLDFAKKDISIEVAFNHSSVIAWNLIKPVLASELNHVEKAIQTQIGVIITATNRMKSAGGFDGAIGTFEKYLDFLPPLQNILTTPLFIIGLNPPKTFEIVHQQFAPRKKIGEIKLLTDE